MGEEHVVNPCGMCLLQGKRRQALYYSGRHRVVVCAKCAEKIQNTPFKREPREQHGDSGDS